MGVCRIAAGLKLKPVGHRGVTLMELLIAVIAFGIVGMGAIGFYRSQRTPSLQRTADSAGRGNLKEIMAELTTQIRQAGYNTQGVLPAQVIGPGQDMLLVHYHDGESVRARIFFLLTDSLGRSNLMTLLDGERPKLFAAGIDSLQFDAGGGEGRVDWVTVNLVARALGAQTETAGAPPGGMPLYRHLHSTIRLKNS